MNKLIAICLRHPAKELRPNGRAHWAARARAARRARFRAYVAMLAQRRRFGALAPQVYVVTWFYKGRRPDADNCLAGCKAYLDGCCDALGLDDCVLECAGICRVHDLVRAGQVEICFGV